MKVSGGICLAVTCHDPLGHFARGIANVAGAIQDLFGALAANVTTETHPATVEALRALELPVLFGFHGAGTVGIGTARKDALELALRSDAAGVFYSDLDHLLRWLSTSRDEVEVCLTKRSDDFLVIGRSVAAMLEAPERLRSTEELVNRLYGLANGLVDRWDLMIAMRLITRATAQMIVTHSRDTSSRTTSPGRCWSRRGVALSISSAPTASDSSLEMTSARTLIGAITTRGNGTSG